MMSKGILIYAIDTKHNHESDPVVFVNTSELVPKTSAGPTHIEPETVAATIKLPAVTNLSTDLKEKMKQRFAVLGRKMQKQ